MELKGSKTEKNILCAFTGESAARNRYTYFAAIAAKEGYVLAARIFEETANQEKEHAKRLFKFLPEGRELEITIGLPAGKMGTTVENLKAAFGGETHEVEQMYPEFAAIAREEGFNDVAVVFENIGKAEKHHAERYAKLAELIGSGKMFARNDAVTWRCLNCGWVCTTKNAPAKCAACDHPQGFFEVLGEVS